MNNWIVLGIGVAIVYVFFGLVTYSITVKVSNSSDREFDGLMNGTFWPLVAIALGLFFFGKKILLPPAQRLADWIT